MEQILNTSDLIPRQLWDRPQRTPDQAHLARVVEAAELFTAGTTGANPWAALALREALARPDFNILLGQSFEVEMLAAYEEITPEWQQIAKRTTVKDFKPKKFIELFGGRDAFEEVKEGAEYKSRSKDEAEYSISTKKFGNTFDLTFELRKNDELDGLASLPDDLAQGARATEDKVAFGAIVTPTGPNTAFFKTRTGKEVSNPVDNKPLTRENLEAAWLAIAARKGLDGRPIRMAGTRLRLVVPQALQFTAEAIVNTPTIEVTEGSSKYYRPNPLFGKFDIVVSWWVSIINESAKVDTTWFIVGAPTLARPAVAFALMRGEENPDIRVRMDQGSRVGGGSVPVDEGSFKDDTISYRGRHIAGAAGLDPISTYASTGS